MLRPIAISITAAAILTAAPARAEWKAVEQVETYAISGRSGSELYASIGERGPKLGITRAIAHTTFKLTWTRKYEPRGNACVLAAAKPKLIITYTLPKPSGELPAPVSRNWQTFVEGVAAHERVHGDHIKAMVREIEAQSVGLTVEGDPGCKKIRTELTGRLAALSQAQRQKSRDFDRVEMGKGGNIHGLILALVNGG
jgi:predicted secreted Zn-dependent protease